MTGKELADFLATVKPAVSSRTLEKIRQVIRLAYEYQYLGEKFTFDKDADLDSEVNRILLAMSDSVIEYIDEKARAAGGDEDEILAYIARPQSGKTLVERVDSYSSHTKYLLEGYVAVCLADKLSVSQALAGVEIYLSSPYSYRLMKQAFSDHGKFDAEIIRARGYHFGKGITTNPVEGLSLTAQVAANEAMQMAELAHYRRDASIIGYRVHRGSSYDCAYCDSLCVGVHPLDDMVLPAHPRCCCYTTPVYGGEEITQIT